MKQKTELIVLAIIASMLLTTIPISVNAWEYANTSIYFAPGPQHDLLSEPYGPMADHVQIIMYEDELAEFSALELGKIDVTDWPVDSAHYPGWTGTATPPDPNYNDSIAVVDTGPEYGMFLFDMRMTNETRIYKQVGGTVTTDLGPNPAYTAPFGNPLADVWLRRAIAACANRKQVVEDIVSGGELPLLAQPLYSVANDPPYTGWGEAELTPAGDYAAITYAKEDGSNNCTLANWFLDNHGYLPIVAGKRTKNGIAFQIEIVSRSDHEPRKLMADALWTCLTAAPPAGLGLDVTLTPMVSGGARVYVMDQKKGHMYTGGWGLTADPDTLYYLFHINNYAHPGRPPNYMYYPGDYAQITVPVNGWKYNYTNVPDLLVTVDWVSPSYQIDFSDNDKTYKLGEKVWKNPQNYWSWQMMIAPDSTRAVLAAHKSEIVMAFFEIGCPIYASRSFTAFSRTYTGPETEYHGKEWKGVVNQAGFGVWSTRSFLNMHTNGDTFGDGNMTIRWGFRQPTMSLNPIYAEWVWDWYVLNQCYDSGIGLDPYQNAIEIGDLAIGWELGQWNASTLKLGMCSKVTFHLRHDAIWSDGVPVTASDFVFTWGGHKVPGSIANLLDSTGQPPAYWDGQIADILSVAAPDPWTVVVYLDVNAYFALHSMSGFNIVLPEHVWKPLILGLTATAPWNQPCVVAGQYKIRSTAQPVVDIWLDKNPMYFAFRRPIEITTVQTSKNTLGNAHWLVGTEKTMQVNVTVKLHNYYAYENGPYIANVYPFTMLDGEKNVTIWKWNQTILNANPSNFSNYVLNKTLATNEPFEALRCTDTIELYNNINVMNFSAGWYIVKVDIHINSLEYWNGATWVIVPPMGNPFYCNRTTYMEYMLVTSRYDIGGLNFKKFGIKQYQVIADLKVDGSDLIVAAAAYGSQPGTPKWNPACDVNGDMKVDGSDLIVIANKYGWKA
jgi:ABC-type oligopeptide transport system substrate-binding subunit